MKMLIVALAGILMVGCGVPAEDRERYHWVIERGNRDPEKIQRDLNIMALHRWYWQEDDDNEQSGHYIYFARAMYPREADAVIKATFEALENRKVQE